MNLDGYALPIKKLKGTEPVESLDLSGKKLGVASTIVIASLISVNGALTSLNLAGNQLCGLDKYGDRTYTAEGITAIADALRVNGSLTSVELRGNKLGDEGWGAIFAAICGNKVSKIMSMDASDESIGPAGVQLIAEALRTSVTGALTSVSLTGNKLGDEGWGAIFAAICGNKDSKIMSMDASSEDIGPAGVKLIAEALRTSVTGSLTVTNLLGNQLDAESAKMLAEVAKQKGISLCGIQRAQTTADFSNQNLKPPEAILLASDLLQAGVTGSLTSINMSGNHLTNFGRDMTGIKELTAALGVNGALTSLDIRSNDIMGDGAAKLSAAVLGNLKIEMFNDIPIKEMHANSITELDLKGKGIGVEGGLVVAGLIPVMGSTTNLS